MSDKKRIHVSGEDYLEAVLLLKKSKDYVRSFEGEDIKKSLKKTAVALFQIQ